MHWQKENLGFNKEADNCYADKSFKKKFYYADYSFWLSKRLKAIWAWSMARNYYFIWHEKQLLRPIWETSERFLYG
jgi:hypothetical protein